jgi:hypothetical protein
MKQLKKEDWEGPARIIIYTHKYGVSSDIYIDKIYGLHKFSKKEISQLKERLDVTLEDYLKFHFLETPDNP